MNKEIILDRFKEMEDNLAILEKLSKIEKEKKAQKDLPRAEGGEAITTLGEHRIIPMEFAKEIRPTAGFRNILVHEYLKIDQGKVHEYTGRIDDFRKFERYIFEFLQKTEER